MTALSVIARRRSGGGAFDPSTISGLRVWHKMDAGVTQAAGKVTALADQSGNSNGATQATGANQFTYVASGQNGLPVARAAGGQYMYCPYALGASFTLFLIGRTANNTQSSGFMTSTLVGSPTPTDGSPRVYMNQNAGTSWRALLENSTYAPVGSAIAANDIFTLVVADTGTAQAVYFNGTQTNFALATAGSDTAFYWGSGFAGGMTGDFFEGGFYNTAISPAQAASLHTYAVSKWVAP